MSFEKPSRREALACLGSAALGLRPVAAAPAAPEIRVAGQPVELRVTARTVRTLRISLLPVLADSQLREVPDLGSVLPAPSANRLLTTRALDAPATLKLDTLEICVTNAPLSIAVKDASGMEVQVVRIEPSGAVAFRIGAGPVFGLGEGGPGLDRRGQLYTTRNGQFSPDKRIQGARVPIPWIVSAGGWALFFHQPFGIIDLQAAEGWFTPQENSSALSLDFFLVACPEPEGILREYAQLTGFPHLPPLWALGYQQSHRTLESRAEVMDEAREFREKKLPCDTMLYLGTGFCPSGWNTGHGSFAFNEKVFPDPAEMIRELHDEHLHVILHLTRPPLALHGTVNDAAAADANTAANYWAAHRNVFRLGVDGWWPDEGDTLDPQARLARNRMYWEGPLHDRPDTRPWALHRNGYAGMQRYAWLWSGDINSDWNAFAAQIPVALNTGLSGIPYWGSDTGGFVPTKELSGELYARWFQFSCFCPLFRSHGRNWKLHLPWGWNTGDFGPLETDPANLPDARELHNATVVPICRKYLDLRYRLLPYLYSAVRESSQTGMPVMRGLWLHYPEDEHAIGLTDQYLWGRDILVAPVLAPGAIRRRVYLPPGTWYDFWTNERLTGGRSIERTVDLQTLPLYVRAGAILPFAPVRQWTGEPVTEPVTLRIYPGIDGAFALYEDDGKSFAYRQGEYMLTGVRWTQANRRMRMALLEGSKMLPPAPRKFAVELAGGAARLTATFTGSPLEFDLREK